MIDFQTDNMDDGLQLMLDEYIAPYTKMITDMYQDWN